MGLINQIKSRLHSSSRSGKRPDPGVESTFFYTFHKCASSLFSGYVLPNIAGLKHVDYEQERYTGRRDAAAPSVDDLFESHGHIYGPIRLSAGPDSAAWELLQPVRTDEFVRSRIALFLIRDPRDILVSRYFSFGFSHSHSAVPEIAERQSRSRQHIVDVGPDSYALEFAPAVRRNFEEAARLNEACERSVVLKFEDMVSDFDRFAEDFTRYMHVDQEVIDEMYRRTRPPAKEDATSHKRSGRAGGYIEKLESETVRQLNETLEPVLNRFGYAVDHA